MGFLPRAPPSVDSPTGDNTQSPQQAGIGEHLDNTDDSSIIPKKSKKPYIVMTTRNRKGGQDSVLDSILRSKKSSSQI